VVAISLDSKQHRSQIKEGILNSNKKLDQYFLEEVYYTWTDEKKAFFLQTSILDSLCGSLCNAVTGYDNSGSLLVRLNQGNSFLIPLTKKTAVQVPSDFSGFSFLPFDGFCRRHTVGSI
jgi:LuxR family maltose regulon positive regulatory protein